MSEFNPSPHDRVVIAGQVYEVMPHPSVPTFAFGQEGRKAFVFQIMGGSDGALYALKKFKLAFRVSELVDVCDSLARFAQWPGLEVCARECLHVGAHDDALDQFPDLEFAVLMPWIAGSTWYDVVIGMKPLSRLDSLTYGHGTAQVLAALEEAGLAHCDIAAPNVIINSHTGRTHLIDIEDLYAPGFAPPAALPAGTDGYAHLTASDGLWGPYADRFAGAVLITEMLAWHIPEIRQEAEEEHYFAAGEMQQDVPRYRLMSDVLASLDSRLVDLFKETWFAPEMDACPRLKDWQEVIYDIYHREKLSQVVSDWQPILITSAATPEPQPIRPAPEEPAQEAKAAPEVEPVSPIISEPEPEPRETTPAAPAAKPIQVPAQQQPTIPAPRVTITPPAPGGPVTEWRPLDLPPNLFTQTGNGSPGVETSQARRPIPVPTPTEPTVRSERPIVTTARDAPERETTAEAEPEPETDDSEPHPLPPEPEPGPGPGGRPAPAGPEPRGLLERFGIRWGRQKAPPTLLKPILDLGYVDARNRPYLVWTESEDATHYVLQESQEPGFTPHKTFTIRGGETRWHPRRGRSGTWYYRIRAAAGDDLGPWSEPMRIRVGE